MMTWIDLDKDLGEVFGAWRLIDDHAPPTTVAQAWGSRAYTPLGALVSRREPGAIDLARRETKALDEAGVEIASFVEVG